MVYIKKWAEFHAQSIGLAKQSPKRTRYVIKATPSQQWLILKVTDDDTCLKFRARSAIIINRFESFTRDMTALLAGLDSPSAFVGQPMDLDIPAVANAASSKQQQKQQQTAAISNTGGGGGVSKKKKKKGKK